MSKAIETDNSESALAQINRQIFEIKKKIQLSGKHIITRFCKNSYFLEINKLFFLFFFF